MFVFFHGLAHTIVKYSRTAKESKKGKLKQLSEN